MFLFNSDMQCCLKCLRSAQVKALSVFSTDKWCLGKILQAVNSYKKRPKGSSDMQPWFPEQFTRILSLRKTNICRGKINGPALQSHWISSNDSVHNFILTTPSDLKPITMASGILVWIWNLSIITIVVSHNIVGRSLVGNLKILMVIKTTSHVTETCTLLRHWLTIEIVVEMREELLKRQHDVAGSFA